MITYKKKVLKNKLEAYALPMNKNSGVTNVDIFYKVGPGDEAMGKNDITHMLGHLNFKNTKDLNAGEFDAIVKGFGGVDNASMGFDYTYCYIKCPKQNLEQSLGLFAEPMQNLSLKDEGFQPERQVILEERRWRTDNNPLGYLYFRLCNHTFLYHPYHWTPIGFCEDIKDWSIEDIKSFHKSFHQPQNAILLVSGDVGLKDLFGKTSKHFEKIKNAGKIPGIHAKKPRQDEVRRAELAEETQAEFLALALKIPNFKHKDIPALSILAEFLGNGKSAIANGILVDKLSLVNEFYALVSDSADENLFMFILNRSPGVKAEEVEEKLLAILHSIKQGKISKRSLQRVKNSTRSDFVLSLNNVNALSNICGNYLAEGDLEPSLDHEKNIAVLKLEDLVGVATKYLVRENPTTSILRKENDG